MIKDMPKEWRIFQLGELGSFRNGVNFNRSQFGDGLPLINVKNLYSGRFVETSNLPQIKTETIKNPNPYFVQKGDILFARSSVMASGAGQVAMVNDFPPNTVFSGFVIRFRIKDQEKLDSDYLCYLLRSPQYRELFTRIVTGTGIFNLSQQILSGIEVPLPSRPEQYAIAHVLGTLDNKIELNRRMTETLEAMARALFKSWFVDFDPVRAKMEGKEPYGMDEKTAALFPDEMVYNEEVGKEIPEGWRVVPFTDIADILSGGTPKTSVSEYWDGDIPWVSAKDVKNAESSYIIDTERKITDEGVENSNAKYLPKNTTIITARGTVGSFCILSKPMTINQTNYGLKAKEGLGDYYVFYTISNLVEQIKQHSYGTIFDTITTRTFQQFKVTLPDKPVFDLFENKATSIMEAILENITQNQTLTVIRDTLLPKLVSGQIRIEDPEEFLEERGLGVEN